RPRLQVFGGVGEKGPVALRLHAGPRRRLEGLADRGAFGFAEERVVFGQVRLVPDFPGADRRRVRLAEPEAPAGPVPFGQLLHPDPPGPPFGIARQEEAVAERAGSDDRRQDRQAPFPGGADERIVAGPVAVGQRHVVDPRPGLLCGIEVGEAVVAVPVDAEADRTRRRGEYEEKENSTYQRPQQAGGPAARHWISIRELSPTSRRRVFGRPSPRVSLTLRPRRLASIRVPRSSTVELARTIECSTSQRRTATSSPIEV